MRRLGTIVLLCALFSCFVLGGATAGGPGDPLISLSYLTDTYVPAMRELTDKTLDSRLVPVYEELRRALEGEGAQNSEAGLLYAGDFSPLRFTVGGHVELTAFSSFLLTSGTATVTVSAGEVLNLSRGEPVRTGSVLNPGERYFVAENGRASVTVYSDEAEGMVEGWYTAEASGELPAGARFVDIETHWAREYIVYLAERGVVNGVGDLRFNPEGVVNRAMFVTILGRVAGVPQDSAASAPFDDVGDGQWYTPYVAWAAENGIVTGYGDGRFGPLDSITREQMAVITIRFANYLGVTLAETEAPVAFADAEQISAYAADAVAFAQRTGLLTGKSADTFDPKGTAKRAEVCTIVYRFIQRAGLPF